MGRDRLCVARSAPGRGSAGSGSIGSTSAHPAPLRGLSLPLPMPPHSLPGQFALPLKLSGPTIVRGADLAGRVRGRMLGAAGVAIAQELKAERPLAPLAPGDHLLEETEMSSAQAIAAAGFGSRPVPEYLHLQQQVAEPRSNSGRFRWTTPGRHRQTRCLRTNRPWKRGCPSSSRLMDRDVDDRGCRCLAHRRPLVTLLPF
jgi:hypothetical protein